MPNPSGPPTGFDAINVGGVPILGGQGYPYPMPIVPGATYFVSSVVGSNGNTGSASDPFASVSYVMANKAVAQSASNPAGTLIVAMPGHAEALTNATTGSIQCNVAGVTVLGLGTGTFRPTITLGTANTTTIPVSAANVTWINCRFVANFLSIAACFTLAAAKWFNCIGCEFRDTSSILDFLNIIKSTGAANTVDGLTATDNNWFGLGTTSVNAFILSANDIDSLSVLRNKWQTPNVTDQAFIVITAGVLTNADIAYNKGYRASTASTNGSLINVGGSTSTGWVNNNDIQTLGSGDKLFTTTSGLAAFRNEITDVVGASGFLIPTADS